MAVAEAGKGGEGVSRFGVARRGFQSEHVHSRNRIIILSTS